MQKLYWTGVKYKVDPKKRPKTHLHILGQPEAHPNPVRPEFLVEVHQHEGGSGHLQPEYIEYFPS